jgi:multiple sugar transport system substrate-binding protein
MEQFGDAIAKKFPYVTVKFIPDGDGADTGDIVGSGQTFDILIVSIGFINDFVTYGLQYDMSPEIKKNNFKVEALEPSMVNFVKKYGDGKMYALPIFTTAAVLMYNKDLFDKFGVAYPKAGMTWDDTYELAKKMSRTDGGQKYYGFGTSVAHMLRVNQLSLPYVDNKTFAPLINTEGYKKLAQNFARFFNIPGYEYDDKMMKAKTGDVFIKDKNVAMYAYFNSTMVNAPADMNIDAVPLPSFAEKPGIGSQMYPTFAGVTGNSKNKDVAFQIIAYMASDEMQMQFSKMGLGLPVVKNPAIIKAFGEGKPQLAGKNIAAFYPDKPADIFMQSIYDPIAEKYAKNAFNDVVGNKKDLNTAYREAEELAKKDIDSARTK